MSSKRAVLFIAEQFKRLKKALAPAAGASKNYIRAHFSSVKNKTPRKRKLISQVMTAAVSFFILTMIVSSLAIYSGCRNAYLSAKNDMIGIDLEKTKEFFLDLTGNYSWYLEYWEAHPEEVKQPLTDEEFDWAYDEMVLLADPQDTYDFLSQAPAEYQLAFAKDMYGLCQSWINDQLSAHNYSKVYIMDITEENCGFVFFEADKNSDGIRLSGARPFELKDHPAVRGLMSSAEDSVQFEVIKSSPYDDNSYYNGYISIGFGGGSGSNAKAAICISYNWEEFRRELLKKVTNTVLIMALGALIVSAVLMLILYHIAVLPLSSIRNAVQGYMVTKDSNAVIDIVDNIRSGNEIGDLSENIGQLVTEIDGYIDSIKELSVEIMEALAHTIDAKDKYTNGHSTRVAIYSKMIAQKLGMSAEEQENIYYMGLLHDIGKIGVPGDIINKPGPLNDEEFEIIKTHPVIGCEILSEIKSLPDLSVGARWHHERFDGRGYPDRLAGEEIPFLARIIAVADCYDAMTSNRSYRSYLPQDKVRAEIEKNSGTQFDSKAAAAMLEIIDSDTNYNYHE